MKQVSEAKSSHFYRCIYALQHNDDCWPYE